MDEDAFLFIKASQVIQSKFDATLKWLLKTHTMQVFIHADVKEELGTGHPDATSGLLHQGKLSGFVIQMKEVDYLIQGS